MANIPSILPGVAASQTKKSAAKGGLFGAFKANPVLTGISLFGAGRDILQAYGRATTR